MTVPTPSPIEKAKTTTSPTRRSRRSSMGATGATGAGDGAAGAVAGVEPGPGIIGRSSPNGGPCDSPAVMVRKETIRKMTVMNTPITRRPADRDRAVDRVRRLTVGTTVAGIVAIGGFGGLAAATYRGAETQVTTAAVPVTGGADDTSASTSSTSDDATSDDATAAPTTSAGSTATSPTNTSTATSPSVTSTTGTAHATSGGS